MCGALVVSVSDALIRPTVEWRPRFIVHKKRMLLFGEMLTLSFCTGLVSTFIDPYMYLQQISVPVDTTIAKNNHVLPSTTIHIHLHNPFLPCNLQSR